MTAQLTPFSFESREIRVVAVDGESWFVAKDVAEALDYAWAGSATIKHIPEEWKGVNSVLTPFGIQEMAVLSEHGLYFFLNRSDKPKALPFQKWIAGEVLPSIRKTGSYSLHEQSPATPYDLALQLAEQLKGKVLVDSAMLDSFVWAAQGIADALASANRPIKPPMRQTPKPRAPVKPDYLRVMDAILSEIGQQTYPYPYALREVQKVPCLIIRTRHIMEHLASAPRLRSLFESLESQSDRELKRSLRNANLIVQLRVSPTIAGARLAHAVAINLTRFMSALPASCMGTLQ